MTIAFSTSHSQIHGLIYVYDRNDDVVFNIDDQEFYTITGKDADYMNNSEIAEEVLKHYRDVLDDMCSVPENGNNIDVKA